MHDPMSLVFSIGNLIDIWHVDPESDGSDDSCGMFIRARHGDPKMLERIKSDINFQYKYLFNENGYPLMSCQGIALSLFRQAAWTYYKQNRRRFQKFMNSNLGEILSFAENETDSMRDSIIQKYGQAKQEERVDRFASMIYGWILRADRPWYKHPRFHFWHWKINIIPVRKFKRWAFSRCCKCHGRFKWRTSVCSGWDSSGPHWFKSESNVYHSKCVDRKETP